MIKAPTGAFFFASSKALRQCGKRRSNDAVLQVLSMDLQAAGAIGSAGARRRRSGRASVAVDLTSLASIQLPLR
ncbi:TPA: hypothetical protein QDZ75_000501 [Stenotrophomonas maltophilia]|nr:hypothetical protein [Stenotrophomonas maltophilia]HEL5403165.1 hypothetical protein [Stenotrophomonas maltophilia]